MISTALVTALVVAGLFVTLVSNRLQPGNIVGVTIFFVLLGMAYVSIGVNLSSFADSGSRAVVYAVSAYLFLIVVMTYLNNAIYFVLEGQIFPPLVGTSGPPDAGGWWYLVLRLTPGGAFEGIVTAIQGKEARFAPVFEDGIPFYLDTSFAVLTLLFWIDVPVFVGYVWFNRVDIG